MSGTQMPIKTAHIKSRCHAARYEKLQGVGDLARTAYREVMTALTEGRVPLEAQRQCFEMCLSEVEERIGFEEEPKTRRR